MAIHPRYADAILEGRKHVEFRKRALAADVTTVVIYATAPVKRIVGEFIIDRILMRTPAELWVTAGGLGAIEQSSYEAYYEDSDTAVGIFLSSATRYATPIPLAALRPTPAVPQSFSYLPADQLPVVRGCPIAAIERPGVLKVRRPSGSRGAVGAGLTPSGPPRF